MRTAWRDGDRVRAAEVEAKGSGHFLVRVDDAEVELTAELLPRGDLRLVTAQGVCVAEITAHGERRFIHLAGQDFVLDRERGGRRRGGTAGGSLEAPMPGVVARVMVMPGDAVKLGQPLVAIEAMKMEHLIRAPRDGVVKKVDAHAGDMVSPGVALVELEAPA
jgi:biotin carboxyl carrier protein